MVEERHETNADRIAAAMAESERNPTHDDFGAGTAPQFEFGFEPSLETFDLEADVNRVLTGVDQIERRLTSGINRETAVLRTEVMGLQERLRKERLRMAGDIVQGIGGLQANLALNTQSFTASLLNDLETFQRNALGDTFVDQTADGVGSDAPTVADVQAQTSVVDDIVGRLPAEGFLPPGLIPGMPSFPQPGIRPPDVGGGIIEGGIGGIVGGIEGGSSEPIGDCPPVDRCTELFGRSILPGEREGMSPEELAELDRCLACGYDWETAGYPPGGPTPPGQRPGPPQDDDGPQFPGPPPPPPPPGGGPRPQPPPPPGQEPGDVPGGPPGTGPGPTPTEPDQPPPERPGQPPPPDDPIPPPPVPGEGEPPPPGGVDEPDLPIPIPPEVPGPPEPPPPPIPAPPGEDEEEPKERRPDFPLDKPTLSPASVANCFGGPTASFLPEGSPGGFMDWVIAGAETGVLPLNSFAQWLDKENFSPSKAVNSFLGGIKNYMNGAFGPVVAASKCLDPELAGIINSRMLIGFAERWLTDVPDYLTRPGDYKANFKCPSILPNTQEATSAYLANEISQSDLECWVRSNGNLFPEWWKILRAGRSKATPQDLIALLRREEITEEDYNERVRQLGYLDDESEEFRKLAVPIPGIQDLIRFMVRDVEDTDIIDTFGLDDAFDDKWTEKTKQWGEWQGLTPEIAKRYWRAHWIIPSPTQLFEMFHRLRNLPDGHEAKVTEKEIRDALQQQDIPPFWIERFLAVSFNPLTRVDVRRAFDIGVLRREDVKAAYQFRGYDDQNAETLTEFAERNKVKRGSGLPPARAYVSGLVGESEFRDGIGRLGYDEEQSTEVLDNLQGLAEIELRKKCVPAIRRRFLDGELDNEEARVEVDGWINDPRQSERILAGWKCEREARGKRLPLGRLSSMFRDGIIDSTELFERLLKLGYEGDDAGKIINQLEGALERDASKRDAAALKKRKAAEEKERKAAEARANKEKQTLEKSIKQAERLQKIHDANRKSVIGTARTLSDRWVTELDDEFNWLWNFKNELIRDYAESQPFVLSVLATASKSEAAETKAHYIEDVRTIVSTGTDAFQETLLESSNGSA